jgi:hypothetical protein
MSGREGRRIMNEWIDDQLRSDLTDLSIRLRREEELRLSEGSRGRFDRLLEDVLANEVLRGEYFTFIGEKLKRPDGDASPLPEFPSSAFDVAKERGPSALGDRDVAVLLLDLTGLELLSMELLAELPEAYHEAFVRAGRALADAHGIEIPSVEAILGERGPVQRPRPVLQGTLEEAPISAGSDHPVESLLGSKSVPLRSWRFEVALEDDPQWTSSHGGLPRGLILVEWYGDRLVVLAFGALVLGPGCRLAVEWRSSEGMLRGQGNVAGVAKAIEIAADQPMPQAGDRLVLSYSRETPGAPSRAEQHFELEFPVESGDDVP